MLELHHLNNSRSFRIIWLLEELAVPYVIVPYMRENGLAAPAALKSIHPLGKSPIIRDGALTLAESGAITEYLVEAYGGGRLAPGRGTSSYWRYIYWLHYAEGSAMSPLLLDFLSKQMGHSGDPMSERIAQELQLHLAYMDNELATGGPFLVGEDLTAADVLLSFPVGMAAGQPGFATNYPALARFVEAVQARPAYRAATEKLGT